MDVRTKVEAAFLGVAIGDALGMPVETMTPDQIKELHNGKGVTTFMDAIQTRLDSISHYRSGTTTDDWQLTAAIARSLIRKRCYDFDDIMLEHIREANRATAGWGRSTRDSVFAIQRFYSTNGREGRDPCVLKREVAPHSGCGNGVAMKIAPIAMYVALRNGRVTAGEMLRICIEQGMATHDDIRASIAAYSLCWLMSSLVKDKMDVGSRKIPLKLKSLIRATKAAEKMHSAYHPYTDSVSKRLEQICKNDLLNDLPALINTIGTSCYSLESVPFAIAVFFRNPTDFKAGVLEAVNAGGDTDTNAAMVGSLIGANVGMESIPEEWRTFNRTFIEAAKLGSKFFDTFG